MNLRRSATLVLLLGLTGCPVLFSTYHPPRVQEGRTIDVTLEIQPAYDTTDTPIGCLELPPSWSIVSVDYAAVVEGMAINGTGAFDQTDTDMLNINEPNPPNTWSCYRGVELFYDYDAHGTVTFRVMVQDEGSHKIRIANGSRSFGLPFGPVVRRTLAVGVLSDHLDDWEPATIAQQFPERIVDVGAWSSGLVAVTEVGTAMIDASGTGQSWTAFPTGAIETLYTVAELNGALYAGGGSESILTSRDGMMWTHVHELQGGPVYDFAYGNSTYVAASSAGRVLTSTDGIAWIDRTTPSPFNLYGVAYGNGRFVAVGDDGTVVRSTDGIDWRPVPAATIYPLTAIVYAGGLFVAVGGNGRVLTSTSGDRFSESITDEALLLEDIAYGDGVYVVLTSYDQTVLTSRDAFTWSMRDTGTHMPLFGVAFANDVFVAGGEGGLVIRAARPRASANSTFDLGVVELGEATPYLPWWIDNMGPGKLALGEAQITAGTEFTVVADDCSGETLAPNTSCSLALVFAPAAFGARTATAGIATNDPANPQLNVTLAGRAATPDISLTPPTHAFGTVMIGAESTQVFTITNAGDGMLDVGTITGPQIASFTRVRDTCSNEPLLPNASCTFDAVFAPASAETFTDTITVPSNDPDEPSLVIALSGIGAAEPVPNIVVADTQAPLDDLMFNFTSVVPGNSLRATITVANSGTAVLNVGTIAGDQPVAAPFSIDMDNCSDSAVAAGASCTFELVFAPTATGLFSDVFDIPANDPDAPASFFTVSGSSAVAPILCAGSPPTPPILVSPEDGAKDLAVPVKFEWNSSTDAEGGVIQYELSYCKDNTFAGCPPVIVALFSSPLREGAGLLACAGMIAFAAIGFSSGARRSRLTLIIATLGATWMLSACPNDGGSDHEKEVALDKGSTYYWKVAAVDASSCRIVSPVRSFTTAP